jgi:hypothetical protein
MRLARAPFAPALLLAGALAACSDTPASITAPPAVAANQSEGRGDFQRYVAIGTSVSMGVASAGVVGASQANAWPAQLARLAHRELSLPLIAEPGCAPPLAGPLVLGRRVNGDPASGSAVCAPNVDGVTLPSGNVAIDGARTSEALRATPETYVTSDPFRAQLFSRVLAPGQTQVTAMLAQNPKIVSVELGANEVLGARNGRIVPGVTVVPVSAWIPDYDAVLDAVAASGAKKAVLAGLIDDASRFQAFRFGSELWAARGEFALFGVAVSGDCADNRNLVFVPIFVPTAIATAAFYRSHGLTPPAMSCADVGGNDYVLSPADQAALNTQLAQMTAHIREQAAARGYAYFSLGALYELPKPAYSVVTQMTSPDAPYGPYISLDGFHPSAAGQAILADAAARALNATYDMGIETGPTLFAARAPDTPAFGIGTSPTGPRRP